MRIVCQKCEAAYAIDDKYVTPAGVRAQCPRCRHLQLVKRESAGAPSPASSDVTNPHGQLPLDEAAPATNPAAPGLSAVAFDFSPPPPGAPPPPSFDFGVGPPQGGGEAASPFEFGPPPPVPAEARPFEFNAPPPVAHAPPAAVDTSSPFDFSGLQQPPEPGAEQPPPSSASNPDLRSSVTGATCATCGKGLTDAFDLALGTCDDCRAKEADQASAPTGPDTGQGQVERVDTRQVQAAVQRATATRPSSQEMWMAQSVLDDREERRGGKGWVAIVIAVVVLAAVGGLIAWKKPWVRRRPPTARQDVSTTSPVAALVQEWKLNYPELEDEPAAAVDAHLAAGEEALLKDTTQGYLTAREEFEKAVVLDSSSGHAVAGWVLAMAFGVGTDIDESTAKAAEGMLIAAEQNSGTPRAYVAHAHLLLVRGGNSNDVQVLAERGKTSKDELDKSLAALAVGQAMLTKNAQLASRAFTEMREFKADLRRGYYYEAMLAASLGRYREAISQLEKRLAMDPDQWQVSEALARLYVEVGELPRAKKALETSRQARPQNARVRLGLAMLAYQHLGDLNGARAQLEAITADKDIANRILADAFAHLATVHRLSGRADDAEVALRRTFELAPGHVPGKLQQLLLLLDKGVQSQARLTFDALKGKLGDAALEATLQGRLLMLEGKNLDAAAVLSKVHQADPRRADALLLAGAAAALARNDGKAWEYCLRRGLKLDPFTWAVPVLTHLYVRPADLLGPAQGAYASLGNPKEEDPNVELCEGLVAWYAGDIKGAERHMVRVNGIDSRNSDALAFRSLAALKRRDFAGAQRLGAKATSANRTNPNAYLASGAALLAMKKVEAAKTDLNDAQRYGPALLAPSVYIGEIEALQKSPDDARLMLTRVLLKDPLYHEAKRVLYKYSL